MCTSRRYLWLDLLTLAHRMRQDDHIVKVRYFDGRVTAFQIPEQHFAAAQLPEQVRRAGRTYPRPEKWR